MQEFAASKERRGEKSEKNCCFSPAPEILHSTIHKSSFSVTAMYGKIKKRDEYSKAVTKLQWHDVIKAKIKQNIATRAKIKMQRCLHDRFLCKIIP